MNQFDLSRLAEQRVETRISDDLSGLLDKLTVNQIRYCVARQTTTELGAAALECGLQPSTVYNWPPEVEEAVRLIARDSVATALHLRRRCLVEAVAVKVAGLRSEDERVRQAVASELINWELGLPVQRSDVRASGGVVFTVLPPGET